MRVKIKKLKKILNKFKDDDLVVISKDSEGNSFNEFDDFSEQYFFDKKEKEIFDKGDIEENELDIKKLFKCIVLWP